MNPTDSPLPVPTLNILGGGTVARTLAAAWMHAGLIRVRGVANRSVESAQQAVDFIGQGHATDRVETLAPANITLIGCGDDDIRSCAQQLFEAGIVHNGDVVFHCSGLLTSGELEELRDQGAELASMHPMLSFADPTLALAALPGTHCGVEGDKAACETLAHLLRGISCKPFELEASSKGLYHAAAVFACNYMVTLQDIAQECLNAAGIEPALAQQLMHPILKGTVENLANHAPYQALTGPIARGNTRTVANHLSTLDAQAPHLVHLYAALGARTLPLAEKQGSAGKAQLEALANILRNGNRYD